MTKEVNLALLEDGRSAVITDVRHRDESMAKRLKELGFSAGVPVRCVGHSPMGGMTAYLVKGAVIALRDDDAACILADKME